MKIAVVILGLLGSLASIGLGAKWLSDAHKYKDSIATLEQLSGQMKSPQLDAQLGELRGLVKAGYALVGLGILALITSFLVFKMPKVSAILLLVSGIIPVLFAMKALAGTFFVLLAGILAFFAKPKAAASV